MKKIFIIIFFFLLLFSAPESRAVLTDNGDGTVSDDVTGLMWQKCTMGQIYSTSDNSTSGACSGSAGTYSWQAALTQSESLVLAGHGDWRLPDRNELESIVDDSRFNPAIDSFVFPNTVSSSYWSSTTYVGKQDYAWQVNFGHGQFYSYPKSSANYPVRAVRAGQSAGSFVNLIISSVSSTSAPASTTTPGITITGSNFGTNQGSITFGGITAAITSWSDTKIICTAPSYAAGIVDIAITPNGSSTTKTTTFTYNNTYYLDNDSDNFGVSTSTIQAVSLPQGYASNSTDCNDNAKTIYPGATEICGDGIDQNCNNIDCVTINATTTNNGTITPSGTITLDAGSSQTYSITPDSGYFISDLLVDNVSVGHPGSYTFDNITTNHTIAVSFQYTVLAISGEPSALTKNNSSQITVIGQDVVSYKYRLDQGSESGEMAISQKITLTNLNDGPHTLLIIAKNSLGVWQPWESAAKVEWQVDTKIDAPNNLDLDNNDDSGWFPGDNITNKTQELTIKGQGETGAAVKIFVNGTPIVGAEGPVVNGLFSIDIALPEGSQQVSAVQTDALGNISDQSAPLTVVVDTTPPVVTSTPAPGVFGYDISYPVLKVVLSVNDADEGASILYSEKPAYFGAPDSPFIEFINLTRNTVLRTVATDIAGNTSSEESIKFTFDWVDPAVPQIDTYSNISTNTDPNPTFTWQAVGDADHYELQYADNQDFNYPEMISDLTTLSYTVSQPLEPGLWSWRVRAVDAAGNTSGWQAYQYQYTPDYFKRKAIIVAGGGPYYGNTLWNITKACTDYAFDTLNTRDYSVNDDEIRYLSHETPLENNRISGIANNSSLKDLIENWSSDADELLLYINDHGGDGKFKMAENEWLTAIELDSWLDTLQTKKDIKIIFIYEACKAGSFLKYLKSSGSQQRVVLAATETDESARLTSNGTLSFSWFFWSAISSGDTIRDAFVNARQSILSTFDRKQHPLIDATGNGIGGEKDDLRMVNLMYIGRAVVTAADRPIIASVSPDINLTDGDSGEIAAYNVTGSNSIKRVWATVIPPINEVISTDIPITEMPTINLTLVDQDTYQSVYHGFTVPGTYHITVFAEDIDGQLSNPMVMQVVKERGVPGDINGDSIVDLADFIGIMRLLNQLVVSGNFRDGYKISGADVNGDSKPGLAEAVYILKEISK